ncbi:MAG: hypothetical protein JW818_08015 [Pirellulales bacterium]|nr:hypothetical protein [Pirellulales bacterium]
MRFAIALYVLLATGPVLAKEADAPDYWSNIVELSKKGTPAGNPELERYLESLTRDEMLTAARQCARSLQNTLRDDEWGPGVFSIGLVLSKYGEKDGSLSDESLDKLLAILADPKEPAFLRFALANMANGRFESRLTAKQTDRCVKRLTDVLRDDHAPERARDECCRSARSILESRYKTLIYLDPAVREVRRTSLERWREIDSLLDKGDVQLSAATKKKLANWRDRVHAFRKILTRIEENDREPTKVRIAASVCLKTTERLPFLNEKTETGHR